MISPCCGLPGRWLELLKGWRCSGCDRTWRVEHEIVVWLDDWRLYENDE